MLVACSAIDERSRSGYWRHSSLRSLNYSESDPQLHGSLDQQVTDWADLLANASRGQGHDSSCPVTSSGDSRSVMCTDGHLRQ